MFRAHVLIVRRSKLYYTASGIITPIGGHPVHRLRDVEAWNKLIIKFSASSWLIIKINILRCTVSKMSKLSTTFFYVGTSPYFVLGVRQWLANRWLFPWFWHLGPINIRFTPYNFCLCGCSQPSCQFNNIYIYIYSPIWAHVLMNFRGFPPGCGDSVADFWGWDAHEARLRCPDDVWVVICRKTKYQEGP